MPRKQRYIWGETNLAQCTRSPINIKELPIRAGSATPNGELGYQASNLNLYFPSNMLIGSQLFPPYFFSDEETYFALVGACEFDVDNLGLGPSTAKESSKSVTLSKAFDPHKA